jgi:Ca2+-binding EF-hand superfamily protein
MKSIGNGIPLAILAAFILLFSGMPSFAQEKNPSQAGSIDLAPTNCIDFKEFQRQLDADGDGFITRDEWNRVFLQSDKNEDKKLSEQELRFFAERRSNEQNSDSDAALLSAFQRLDANKNDLIDPKEWPGKEKSFRSLDANGDGFINREELLSRNGRYWNQPFDNLDFDGNKIITRSEWLDSDASFKRLDRDSNGVLERREFYNPR